MIFGVITFPINYPSCLQRPKMSQKIDIWLIHNALEISVLYLNMRQYFRLKKEESEVPE